MRGKAVTVGVLIGIVTIVGGWTVRRSSAGVRPHGSPRHRAHTIIVDAAGLLLGGCESGHWVDAERAVRWIRGGERYRFYSSTRYLGNRRGGRAVRNEQDSSCLELGITPAFAAGVKGVGTTGPWEVLPRASTFPDPHAAVYGSIMRRYLQSKGLRSPRLNVTQVVAADLLGDGHEEEIICGNWPDPMPGKPAKGSYCVILLRYPRDTGDHVASVEADIWPKGGDAMSGHVHKSVLGTWDLNGDGTLEIVIREQGYESDMTSVYVVGRSSVRRALLAGWGI